MGQSVKISLVLTGVLASMLEILDSSIVNVAVPDMTGNLQSFHVPDAMGWDLQIGNKTSQTEYNQ